MVDAHQNLNGSRDLTTPLSFKDPRLALTTIDLYTKFEVIVSTIEIELLFGQVIVLS